MLALICVAVSILMCVAVYIVTCVVVSIVFYDAVCVAVC